MLRRMFALSLLMAGMFSVAAAAQDLMTEKKTFELPSYTTAGGKTIKNVRIGWGRTGSSMRINPTPS
jgi:homoserine O-acetyltransferase/O-succinyltransferase